MSDLRAHVTDTLTKYFRKHVRDLSLRILGIIGYGFRIM